MTSLVGEGILVDTTMMKTPSRSSSAAADTFWYGTLATSLAVGALQMYRVRGGWLTSYGADVFGTAWLYAIFRQGRTVVQKRRPATAGTVAALVWTGCAASEFAQRAHWVPGVFDPYDLLSYTVTVLACYAIDRLVIPLA